jgi:hypothetical protein
MAAQPHSPTPPMKMCRELARSYAALFRCEESMKKKSTRYGSNLDRAATILGVPDNEIPEVTRIQTGKTLIEAPELSGMLLDTSIPRKPVGAKGVKPSRQISSSRTVSR